MTTAAEGGADDQRSPQASGRWRVGDCKVDLDRQLLMRAGVPVAIRPKAWHLLCLLLLRPNGVVRSNRLIDALWPRQTVLPKALVNLVSELRGCLGEAAVLESVPRRGYVLRAVPDGQDTQPQLRSTYDLSPTSDVFVGRQGELSRWRALAAESASHGMRLLSLTGQAGVGKTTLVRHGAAELLAAGWTVLSGQCIDTTDAGEPLAPVLQALHAWALGAPDDALRKLETFAPSWLALMPDLAGPERLSAVQAGDGLSRMSREAAALLRRLGESSPVVLIIEDLHWADGATLDLLMHLLPAVTGARLMLVLSWRSQRLSAALAALASRIEAAPLDCIRWHCELQCFSEAEVAEYVDRRLPSVSLSASSRVELCQLTEGLPLFLKLLCDDRAVALRRPSEVLMPLDGTEVLGRLRGAVLARVGRLPSDLRLLMTAASCISAPMPTPLLARVLDMSEQIVQDRCEMLVDLGLFEKDRVMHPWPDLRLVPAYCPAHALYGRLVTEQLGSEAHRSLSQRIAREIRAVAALPATGMTPQLVQAYVAAGMHFEAAQALRDTRWRWVGPLAQRRTVQALLGAIEQLSHADRDDAEVVRLHISLCLDLMRVVPFDCRTDNAVLRRAISSVVEATARREDDDGRWLHVTSCITLCLNEGRADRAHAYVGSMLDVAGRLAPTHQSNAQGFVAALAYATGDNRAALQAVEHATSLLSDKKADLAWSPWLGILLSQSNLAGVMMGRLKRFQAWLATLSAAGWCRRAPVLISFDAICLAEALVRFGCRDAAARLYEEVLVRCEEHDHQHGAGAAWLGLIACQPAKTRHVEALQEFVAAIPERGMSSGDHLARLLIVDSLIERSLWDAASIELEAASYVSTQWPLLHSEMLRLEGRLHWGRGQFAAAQRVWEQALDLDLEKCNLGGTINCMELLERVRSLDKSTVLRCGAAFPEWLETELEGEFIAPLAEAQRRHRSILRESVRTNARETT